MNLNRYNEGMTTSRGIGFSATMESTLETSTEKQAAGTFVDPNEVYIHRKFPNLTDWQWHHIQNFSRDGQKCMLDFWYHTPDIKGPYCNATWDDFLCWPATPGSQQVRLPCPGMETDEYSAYRECTRNGTWAGGSWTNYSECADALLARYKEMNALPTVSNEAILQAALIRDITFIGSIISLVFLTVTLFIFCFFKSLQCTRVSIHKHLVISYIFRFIIVIIIFEPFVSERKMLDTYRSVEWLCKLLTTLLNYALIANIFWMLVEGLFLTSRIAFRLALNKEPHFGIFYAIGWVLPVPFAITWAMCMHFYHTTEEAQDFTTECWQDWSSSVYTWLIGGPVAVALVVNLGLLVLIISILVGKLTARHNVEAAQIGKAVKATAVLFPLLGMTNFLFFWKPSDEHVTALSYHVTNAILQGTQGIFVSVIYCFLNGEVQTACRKKWQRYRMQRMNEQQNYKRRTSHTSSFFLSQTENQPMRDKTSNGAPSMTAL